MDKLNEQLDPKFGWASGRKYPQRGSGLKRSGINSDVLAWVPGVDNVSVRSEADKGVWLYRLMTWPGMDTKWIPCNYVGTDNPVLITPEDAIAWASKKKFQGIKILD